MVIRHRTGEKLRRIPNCAGTIDPSQRRRPCSRLSTACGITACTSAAARPAVHRGRRSPPRTNLLSLPRRTRTRQGAPAPYKGTPGAAWATLTWRKNAARLDGRRSGGLGTPPFARIPPQNGAVDLIPLPRCGIGFLHTARAPKAPATRPLQRWRTLLVRRTSRGAPSGPAPCLRRKGSWSAQGGGMRKRTIQHRHAVGRAHRRAVVGPRPARPGRDQLRGSGPPD